MLRISKGGRINLVFKIKRLRQVQMQTKVRTIVIKSLHLKNQSKRATNMEIKIKLPKAIIIRVPIMLILIMYQITIRFLRKLYHCRKIRYNCLHFIHKTLRTSKKRSTKINNFDIKHLPQRVLILNKI